MKRYIQIRKISIEKLYKREYISGYLISIFFISEGINFLRKSKFYNSFIKNNFILIEILSRTMEL